MKLIDDTINPKEKVEFLSATVFAGVDKQIPHIVKAGSIVRLHRIFTHKFKGVWQINCDVGKGAWLVFDPIEGALPVDQSGKSFTFNEEDKARLKDARKFAKEFFAKNELPAITLKKAAADKPKDFDTLCMVLKAKKGDKVELRDGDTFVGLTIPKGRGLNLAQGEVIRIRSANFDKPLKNLSLNDYSSVLKVPE
jgi:hypothetical protein